MSTRRQHSVARTGATKNARQSPSKRIDLRDRFEHALPGTNELLARLEHALAMEMIHILGKRG